MEIRKGKRYYKMFIDGKNVLKGKKATCCRSYGNGDYKYHTRDEYWHLIRDGVDLLKGKKARECWSHYNGDYVYQEEDGGWHKFNKDHEEID